VTFELGYEWCEGDDLERVWGNIFQEKATGLFKEPKPAREKDEPGRQTILR
jgi:hypothetical protein